MKKTKRIVSYLQKQGYTEAQVEARLNNLTAPFQQRGKYSSTLPQNYQWIEDYPLLANLYELKAQKWIKQGRLLPKWVRENILQVLKMAETEDPDNAEWRQLVWSVYWFTKFSAFEVVALAVAKIQAKWNTGNDPTGFFTKLKQQEKIAIYRAIVHGWPAEAVNDPKWRSTKSQTAQGVGPRKGLTLPVDACPLDDRDTNLDSEDEKRGYGFPEEDFDKDRRQLAFLLGGSTPERNVTWIGLTIPFIWPDANSGFIEVPLANPRVSTTAEGVMITLTSAFAPLDWVKNPLLQEQIKDAIKARFGFFEKLPYTLDMTDYLEEHKDIDMPNAQYVKEYNEKVKMGIIPRDKIKDPKSSHRMMRLRAKVHPLLRM